MVASQCTLGNKTTLLSLFPCSHYLADMGDKEYEVTTSHFVFFFFKAEGWEERNSFRPELKQPCWYLCPTRPEKITLDQQQQLRRDVSQRNLRWTHNCSLIVVVVCLPTVCASMGTLFVHEPHHQLSPDLCWVSHKKAESWAQSHCGILWAQLTRTDTHPPVTLPISV